MGRDHRIWASVGDALSDFPEKPTEAAHADTARKPAHEQGANGRYAGASYQHLLPPPPPELIAVPPRGKLRSQRFTDTNQRCAL